MTPQPTPQAIKEAAESYNRQKLIWHNKADIVEDFIAGATHPETERYYKGKHDQEMLGFMNWIDAKNIPINMNNFPGFLSAYRYEQTTKNKEDGHSNL